MDWEGLLYYVKPELFVLIPVLWMMGMIIKKTKPSSKDKIPLILLVVGIGLTTLWLLGSQLYITNGYDWFNIIFMALVQGTLTAGGAVLAHEVSKHRNKS